jgi:hypothetical protein
MHCYREGVARRHQRFALRDVTFAGMLLPGATMDCREDDEGRAPLSARVAMRLGLVPDEGQLADRTVDGRVVTGHPVVADRQIGAGGRRANLVEFHGLGFCTA